MATVTVLLVEDDPDLQVTTTLVLRQQGFDVVVAPDGVSALEELERQDVDVALVDIVMPRMDGLTLTRRIRERSDLPVLLLTARELASDQVLGLEAGADDYIVKPFDGDVLAARIRTVLRRAGGGAPARVRRGDLLVDPAGMTVEREGHGRVELSSTEFRLLMAFVDNPGIVLSRERLMDIVWGSTWGDPHVVEVTLGRLRAKIGAEHVVTVRGAGYKMGRT